MDSELIRALDLLGFEQSSYGEKVPKLKFVTKKYHKLVQKNHPDKGGDEELCKKITEAYRLIGEYLEKQEVENNEEDYDFEEEVAMKTFQQFKANVKENLKSFTINIDNDTSYTWEKVLTKHYGTPIDRKTNGLHWKVKDYTDGNIVGNITIGKWHKPKKDNKSKLHVQSNEAGNFLPAHFVDHKLPKLFQEVSKIHTANKSQARPKTPFRKLTNPRVSIPKTVKCDECEFSTKIPSQMAKHKKLAHKDSPCSNEVPKEEDEYPSILLSFHCMMCGKGFSHERSLSIHEKNVHEIKCTSCECAFYTNDDLAIHVKNKHSVDQPQQTSISTPSKQQKTCLSCEITDADSVPSTNKIVELLKCEKCPFTTCEDVVLKHHVLMMHVPGFECHECGEIIWPEDPVSDCSVCSFFFHKKCTKSDVCQTSPSNWTCHYCCNICHYTSTNEKSLEVHMLSNHNPDTGFQCDICLQGFQYDDNLKIHMMYCHPDNNQLPEKNNGEEPPQKMDENVFEDTQRYKCDLCSQTFTSEEDFNNHQKEHQTSKEQNNCEGCKTSIKTSNLKITCIKCDHTFHKKCTSLKSATGHWKPTHWECERCQIVLENQTNNENFEQNEKEKDDAEIIDVPQRPSAKHRKSNAVGCNHPDKEFLISQINTLKSVIAKREAELKKVQESETLKTKKIIQLEAQLSEARKIGCITLDEENDETQRIKKLEMKTTTLENQVTILFNKLENRESYTQVFNCDICDSEFNQRDALNKHKRETHVTTENDVIQNRRHHQSTNQYEQLYCPRCDYISTSDTDLNKHMQTEHHKCNSCSYHAIHQKDLRRHKITMHNQVNPCTLCPYKAINDSDLRRHIQTMHKSDANLSCNTCDHNATSEPEQRRHQNMMHNNHNTFICNFCSCTFRTKRELNVHLDVNHKQMQRTRIFSSNTHPTQRRQPAQKSPYQDELFRPWSSSDGHPRSYGN